MINSDLIVTFRTATFRNSVVLFEGFANARRCGTRGADKIFQKIRKCNFVAVTAQQTKIIQRDDNLFPSKAGDLFMLYSINKNDKVDTIFTTHLNNILDMLQQIDDYLNCDDKTIFIKYGITKKDVAALVANIKIELGILYERYTNLGYTYNTAIAQQFKMCYEKLYLVA